MPKVRFFLPLVLAFFALSLPACGGEDEPAAGEETAETTTDGTAGGDEVVIDRPIGFDLTQLNDSGVTGSVTLTDAGSEQTSVEIVLDSQGTEGPPRPAHIHEGTCQNFEQEPLVPLKDVDEDGTSETIVKRSVKELLEGDLVVNVHESAEKIENVIACGTIPDMEDVQPAEAE